MINFFYPQMKIQLCKTEYCIDSEALTQKKMQFFSIFQKFSVIDFKDDYDIGVEMMKELEEVIPIDTETNLLGSSKPCKVDCHGA